MSFVTAENSDGLNLEGAVLTEMMEEEAGLVWMCQGKYKMRWQGSHSCVLGLLSLLILP